MHAETDTNPLGQFLRDRRGKLNPAAFGFPSTRRRTPGLRREEVALLAHVSPAWYTWLEQGRGGVPSADVLDRLARGLGLTAAEREHLFLLAQNRPPEVSVPELQTVDPSLQRLVDSLVLSPAVIHTPAWDVLAANRVALILLGPPGEVPPRYNILEGFFLRLEAGDWAEHPHQNDMVRAIVARFRAEAFRAGFGARVQEVVNNLVQTSSLFREVWRAQEVDRRGEPVKTFLIPGQGPIALEPTTFSVDASPGLKLVVFTPVSALDRDRIRVVLESIPG
jgi:transcriptional regulator with XRE-family HTH domain